MVKEGKIKGTKKPSKTKKGAKYVCAACGMMVAVAKECGCNPCDISCCGKDMRLLVCC